MAYRSIINKVLRRLREETISADWIGDLNDSSDVDDYQKLIGDLVNEAQGQFGQSGTLAFSAINDKVKDLQDEIKKLSKSEGSNIRGQLRLVFEHYKKELTKKINTSP